MTRTKKDKKNLPLTTLEGGEGELEGIVVAGALSLIIYFFVRKWKKIFGKKSL